MLYGLLVGAARVARMCRIPMAEVAELLQMASFREARSHGLRLKEVASLLGVSLRKASQLSQRLKSNFLGVEQAVTLPRRIEFLLWAEPMSRTKIRRAMHDQEPRDVDDAIDTLLEQQRIRERRDRRTVVYERVAQNSRLIGADDRSRLDGLNHAVGVLTSAIFGRFFRDEDKAFYRTISFYVRAEDLGELRAFYDSLWERVQALEDRAQRDPNALRMEVTLAYAPHNYLAEETRDDSAQ